MRRLRARARQHGPLRPVGHGPRSARRVALTFDDGPGRLTAQVLDALAAHGVRATFNVLGQRVGEYPELLRRTLREGHEVGSHAYRHDRLARRPRAAHRQLRRTNAALEETTGVTPRVFRPPYGAWSRGLVLSARLAGLRTVTWDVDPRDWEAPGAEAIHERVVSAVKPGSIVLLHDERRALEQTVVAVGAVLRELGGRGYEFVTVSELLGWDAPGRTRTFSLALKRRSL